MGRGIAAASSDLSRRKRGHLEGADSREKECHLNKPNEEGSDWGERSGRHPSR
jgi:hypothetical protein